MRLVGTARGIDKFWKGRDNNAKKENFIPGGTIDLAV